MTFLSDNKWKKKSRDIDIMHTFIQIVVTASLNADSSQDSLKNCPFYEKMVVF